MAILFLSDGEPSDARANGLTPSAAQLKICRAATDLATKYEDQITMSMVGLAAELHNFSTLKAMAKACNDAPGGAHAEFVFCEKIARSVGTAATSLTTSLTQTRTSLMGRGNDASGRQKRVSTSEKETGIQNSWRYFRIIDHVIFDPNEKRLVNCPGLPPGAIQSDKVAPVRYLSGPPPVLAMNSSHCGLGAERLAFRCRLADSMSPSSFVFAPMVAKETNIVEKMSENESFHVSFCETQNLASCLADEFNKRLPALPGYNSSSSPKINFLSCSVFVLADNDSPDGYRGVLVEKMLDVDRFGWSKWNDNAGGVDGKAYHAPIDVEYELAVMSGGGALGGICEEDSDEESDDEYDDEVEIKITGSVGQISHVHRNVNSPSDYLQAFSHFSYLFTDRKLIVCDLQGVYNTDTVLPMFELTDPVIHYRSNKGRRMVFERTDEGQSGVQLFFKTHKCNDICKRMSLSKKNNVGTRIGANVKERDRSVTV